MELLNKTSRHRCVISPRVSLVQEHCNYPKWLVVDYDSVDNSATN